MYAYVDESGNTGMRIFDAEQPLFITAALITKTNFDATKKAELPSIAKKIGATALHANELGVAKIELIADDLLRLIKQADARFFVSRVEKRYLATCKVFDTYFDAGENLAVPWTAYWVRPLRLSLMFMMAEHVMTEEIVRTVWDCVTAASEYTSKRHFIAAAQAMLERAPNMPDHRSQSIVIEALQWAIANPDSFSTHMRNKLNRHGHSPNLVAFTNLMVGLTKTSDAWKRPVKEIVHDQQSEFGRKLKDWHELYSHPELAKQEPTHWPLEDEPWSLSRVPGSTFRMTTEQASPGLQVIDVILWLIKRHLDGKDMGHQSAKMLRWVFHRAYENDFSFPGVSNFLEHKLDAIFSHPITQEQERKGRDLMVQTEVNRQAALAEYDASKVGPEPTLVSPGAIWAGGPQTPQKT
jgi:hypothetical protein